MDLFSLHFPPGSCTSTYFFTLCVTPSIGFPDASFPLFSTCYTYPTMEQEHPFASAAWFAFHPYASPVFLFHSLLLLFPDPFPSSLPLLVTFKFCLCSFCFFILCPLWLMPSFSVPPLSFPPFMISNNLEVDSSFFFPHLCCFFPLSLLSSPLLSSCSLIPADFIFPSVCIACGPLL